MPKISNLITVAALSVAGLFPGFAVGSEPGQVVALDGPANLLRDNNQLIRVQVGTTLQVGDIVQTLDGGKVQWNSPDESIIALAPNSRLVIDQYGYRSGSAGEAKYTLDEGAMATVSGAIQSSAYRVKTPHADIGIKGTQYKAKVCNGNCEGLPDGLYVRVIEGQVEVGNDAGSLLGSPGQTIFASDRGTAPAFTDANLAILIAAEFDFDFEFGAERFADIVERSVSAS